MRDVDFDFYDEAGDDGPDEVLDTGPRRSIPSWVLGLTISIVVIALFVFAVVHGNDPAPSAGPAPASSHAPSPGFSEPSAPAGQILAFAADSTHSRIFLLADRLYVLRANGDQLADSGPIDPGGDPNTSIQLLFDPRNDIVWAVPLTDTGLSLPGTLEGFSGATLKRVVRAPLVGQVTSAAVLDGELYLVGQRRLLRYDRGGHDFHIVTRVGSGTATVLADPLRRRLLYIRYGEPLRIGSWTPSTKGSGLSRPVDLPFSAGGIAVVGRTIWAVGTTGRHAVLSALDPGTFRAGRNIAQTDGLGASLGLAGTGNQSLYVRNARGARDVVLCLNGTTGSVQRDFGTLSGAFIPVGGRAVDEVNDAVHPLAMGRCAG